MIIVCNCYSSLHSFNSHSFSHCPQNMLSCQECPDKLTRLSNIRSYEQKQFMQDPGVNTFMTICLRTFLVAIFQNLFYNAIYHWLLTPLYHLVGGASDQQLLQFRILYFSAKRLDQNQGLHIMLQAFVVAQKATYIEKLQLQ